MLIYSKNLYEYVIDKVIPKLIITDNFELKGSFKRRSPYVTDIDVVNDAYPSVTKKSIYAELLKLIKRLDDYPQIILINVTCGIDKRFDLKSGSEDELKEITPLLTDHEITAIDFLRIKYANDTERYLFYLRKLLKPLRKLRWTSEEVVSGKKLVRGDLIFDISQILKQNKNLIIKYAVPLEGYMVGFDVAVYYDEVDSQEIYRDARQRHLKDASYNKQYYKLLLDLKGYFYEDKETRFDIDNITQKKLGLYKQQIARLELYDELYRYGQLTIKIAKAMLVKLIQDLAKLSKFKSNAIYQIKKIAINAQLNAEQRLESWHVIIETLIEELKLQVNMLAKPYYEYYVAKIPVEDRPAYCVYDEMEICLQK
jgi:hypothetical protein